MYGIVRDGSELVDITGACSALGVSRSGYAEWLTRSPRADSAEMTLKGELQRIAMDFPCYGYRRMAAALQRLGFPVNRKRVLRLMREDNLLCVKRVFKPATTDSNHSFRVYPNLADGLEVSGLNQLWVADITYIRLLTEFVYLAVIMDVFSRKCIGWALDRNIDAQLALNTLHMTLKNRQDADLSGLIHHSDQGVQYASTAYVELLKKQGIRISMSRKGNPYDNAFAESFIKTLKCEEVYLREYETFGEAHANVRQFIEDVYNAKRLHSGIGYKAPNELEKEVSLIRTVA